MVESKSWEVSLVQYAMLRMNVNHTKLKQKKNLNQAVKSDSGYIRIHALMILHIGTSYTLKPAKHG